MPITSPSDDGGDNEIGTETEDYPVDHPGEDSEDESENESEEDSEDGPEDKAQTDGPSTSLLGQVGYNIFNPLGDSLVSIAKSIKKKLLAQVLGDAIEAVVIYIIFIARLLALVGDVSIASDVRIDRNSALLCFLGVGAIVSGVANAAGSKK